MVHICCSSPLQSPKPTGPRPDIEGFSGPKTVNDTYGNPRPYEAYVRWLEEQILALRQEVASAKSSLYQARQEVVSYQQRDQRRYQYDQDYLPYADDEYDRD